MYQHFQLKVISHFLNNRAAQIIDKYNKMREFRVRANEMARTRYKHFKSVVICQCELKVVFLSARSFQSLSAIAQLNSLLSSSFMRPVLLLLLQIYV
mgnify:CR=1 FL=1